MTPTDAPTAVPGGDGPGDDPLGAVTDGLSQDWVPYAGAGALAGAATLAALIKRFGGGGGSGGNQADALDWGGGLDDDE